jgi:hypothetical protein
MFQTKVIENIKTHTLCAVTLLFFENHAVYEVMWENTVETDKPKLTIQYGTCAVHAG